MIAKFKNDLEIRIFLDFEGMSIEQKEEMKKLFLKIFSSMENLCIFPRIQKLLFIEEGVEEKCPTWEGICTLKPTSSIQIYFPSTHIQLRLRHLQKWRRIRRKITRIRNSSSSICILIREIRGKCFTTTPTCITHC